MAGYRVVHVVCESIAHDAGHWCRSCALPSGIRQWVAVRFAMRMHLQVRVWCDECGGHDIDLNPPGR